MCGLLGVAGPGIQIQDLYVFKDLGVVSQLRGTDGSGVYQVKSNAYGKAHNFECLYKTVNPFNDLLDEIYMGKQNTNVLNNVQVDVVMGHVRAATRGSLSSRNAHPFRCKHLIGMHNGTLKDEKYKHEDKTDSELMFTDMSRNGIEETLVGLNKDSAYAVVIYDESERCLFLAKNEKRTLSFALLKDRNVLYWASERLMLSLVLKRRGLEATYFQIKDNMVYRLRPQTINKGKGIDDIFTIVADLNEPEEKKEVKDILSLPFSGPTTPVSQQVRDVAKELENKEDKETKKEGATILQFGRAVHQEQLRKPSEIKKRQEKYPKGDTRQYHLFCNCGKDSLNLYEAFQCKAGAQGYPKYNQETNTFDCQYC